MRFPVHFKQISLPNTNNAPLRGNVSNGLPMRLQEQGIASSDEELQSWFANTEEKALEFYKEGDWYNLQEEFTAGQTLSIDGTFQGPVKLKISSNQNTFAYMNGVLFCEIGGELDSPAFCENEFEDTENRLSLFRIVKKNDFFEFKMSRGITLEETRNSVISAYPGEKVEISIPENAVITKKPEFGELIKDEKLFYYPLEDRIGGERIVYFDSQGRKTVEIGIFPRSSTLLTE